MITRGTLLAFAAGAALLWCCGHQRLDYARTYELDPRFRYGHCLPFCKDVCAKMFDPSDEPCLPQCMGKCPYDDPENQ